MTDRRDGQTPNPYPKCDEAVGVGSLTQALYGRSPVGSPNIDATQGALTDIPSQRPPYEGVLCYVYETDEVYCVRLATGQTMNVAKRRSVSPSYPPAEASHLTLAARWLVLSILGLLPAGLGSLMLAPLAVLHAWQAINSGVSEVERTQARILSLIAGLVMLLGLLLSSLLVAHLIS